MDDIVASTMTGKIILVHVRTCTLLHSSSAYCGPRLLSAMQKRASMYICVAHSSLKKFKPMILCADVMFLRACLFLFAQSWPLIIRRIWKC